MVRHYKRKSIRGSSWGEEALQKARTAVMKEEMSLAKASKIFGIPKTTLRRHSCPKQKIKYPGKKRFGRETVLGRKFEDELEGYVVKMQQMFHGITPVDLRTLAFDLAEKNNIPHPFNREKGMAGKDWFSGFMRRHPNLSVREPEPTSLSRAAAFNRVQVGRFFQLYSDVLEKEHIPPTRIYNADESGISTYRD